MVYLKLSTWVGDLARFTQHVILLGLQKQWKEAQGLTTGLGSRCRHTRMFGYTRKWILGYGLVSY